LKKICVERDSNRKGGKRLIKNKTPENKCGQVKTNNSRKLSIGVFDPEDETSVLNLRGGG